MKIDFYDLERQVLERSYFEFCKTFWSTVTVQPLILNWHIEKLCQEIQDNCERVFAGKPRLDDLVCNVPPGTSKSSIFSIFLLPWCWTRMPGMRYIGASFAEDLAYELSVKSRMVVTSPLYKKLWPKIELRPDVNNKGHWGNVFGGSRYAVSIGGNITGRHADIIVIDDPVDPRMGRSKVELEKAAQYCCETLPSRKTSKEISWTAMVMQRISIADPTELFLARPDVKHICLPAILNEDVKPAAWAKYYKDGLLDPARLTQKSLERLEIELGQYGYAGQILQRPLPLGGGMFKIDRIVQHEVAPEAGDFEKIVRFWDKAASAGTGDYTVGLKMGKHKDGSFWILDIVRGQWSTEAREQVILTTAKKDGTKVRIGLEKEPGSAGVDSAKATAKMLSGYLVYPEPATGCKELRADTFSVQVNLGNVHTALRGKLWQDYLQEMLHFPNGKNDDQIDASSGAFSMLVNHKVRLGLL